MAEENKWTPEQLTCIAMAAEHVGKQAEKMAIDFFMQNLRMTTAISADGEIGILLAAPDLVNEMRDAAEKVLQLDRENSVHRTRVEDPDDEPCQN